MEKRALSRNVGSLNTYLLHTITTTIMASVAHPAIRSGNVAVLTGGASGIGLALAQLYHKHGMSVAVGDIDTDALAKVPNGIHSVQVDVTSKDSLASFKQDVEK